MFGGVHIAVLLAVLGGVTLVLAESHTISEPCTKMGEDPCRCQMDSGEIIDLTPLDSKDYLKPRFIDVPVTETYVNSTDLFSWNPCTPFCERHCEGAATCQNESVVDDLFFTIGKHDTANFTLNLPNPYENFTDKLTLSYSYTQSSLTRTSVILLLCDENATEDSFIPYGEMERGSMYYYFTITSKHVCPQNESDTTAAPPPTQPSCPHPWTTTPTEPPLTTQSPTPSPPPTFWDFGWKVWVAIGCLSVVLLVLIYFVIGLSINLIRGRRGMAVVPHYLCWLACCKCCKSFQRTENRKLLKEYSDDISS